MPHTAAFPFISRSTAFPTRKVQMYPVVRSRATDPGTAELRAVAGAPSAPVHCAPCGQHATARLVSDVQIYLDLLRVGLRGEEQADELRRWPDFAGGWA